MNQTLADRLRETRRGQGRTQEDTARALNVTPQAVSRWETGAAMPDIALLPSIANYYGVTIDSLFGYVGERERSIDERCAALARMNRENNGVDVSMDDCIRMAREALTEFPGNEKLMQALAEILYNAGYVRHGEHHVTDADGYDVLDTEKHRACAEWREAIRLYEALLPRLPAGERRWRAVRELTTLYALTGQEEKAAALAEQMPGLSDCREWLRLNALSGKRRAEACRETALALADALKLAMVQCLLGENTLPAEAVKRVENIIAMLTMVAGDGFGDAAWLGERLTTMQLFLADRRWTAGDADGAFAALDEAVENAAQGCPGRAAMLPEDYPWWHAVDSDGSIREDPRWRDWADRARRAQ